MGVQGGFNGWFIECTALSLGLRVVYTQIPKGHPYSYHGAQILSAMVHAFVRTCAAYWAYYSAGRVWPEIGNGYNKPHGWLSKLWSFWVPLIFGAVVF